jgi:hypothetical protein
MAVYLLSMHFGSVDRDAFAGLRLKLALQRTFFEHRRSFKQARAISDDTIDRLDLAMALEDR